MLEEPTRTRRAPRIALSEPQAVARRASVLVVDDDSDILDLARLLLEASQCQVDTARDGWQGLAAARARSHDAIVLDITMPHLDGIELGTLLRADPLTRDVLIVVHTALNEGWLRSFFTDYDLFLSKPRDSGRLAEAVLGLVKARWPSSPI